MIWVTWIGCFAQLDLQLFFEINLMKLLSYQIEPSTPWNRLSTDLSQWDLDVLETHSGIKIMPTPLSLSRNHLQHSWMLKVHSWTYQFGTTGIDHTHRWAHPVCLWSLGIDLSTKRAMESYFIPFQALHKYRTSLVSWLPITSPKSTLKFPQSNLLLFPFSSSQLPVVAYIGARFQIVRYY